MRLQFLLVVTLLAFSSLSLADDANANPACKTDKRIVAACFTVHGRFAWWNEPPTRRIEVIEPRRTLAIGEDTALPEGLNRWQRAPIELAARLANYNDVFIATFEVCPLSREEAGKMQTVCLASVSEAGASAEIRDSPAESQMALDRARQKVAEDLARTPHMDSAAAQQMTNRQLKSNVHQFSEQLRNYGLDQKVEAVQLFQRIQGDTLRQAKAAAHQLSATGKNDLAENSIHQQMDTFEKRMQAAGQDHLRQAATQYMPTAVVLRDELLRRLGQKMPADPDLVYVWDIHQEGQFQEAMSEFDDLNHTGFEATADLLESLANQLPQ
jgi:hypothetical protein